MKRVHTPEPGEPSGYERVLIDSSSQLLLPRDAAAAYREQLRQRDLAAEDERQADRRRRHEEAREKALADERLAANQGKARCDIYPAEPRPGWYRVIPKLKEFDEGSGDAVAVGRCADSDVSERRLRVRKKLLELGPDRRIAHAECWTETLGQLEASLPHFRGPIQVIRNAMALTDATGVATRIQPMLLLGPPGVGKTYFSNRVAELLGAPHAAVQFDQPSAGSQLRGSDKHWSTSESGVLFNLICLGEYANPVVLLDELDKSAGGSGRRDLDPLAQLHGALEPETSRRMVDISVEVEFDASLTTYIATANTVQGVGLPLLSRMEVFVVEPPTVAESFDIARSIVEQVLHRFHLTGQLVFERRAVCLLAHLSPRRMVQAVERVVAAAVSNGTAKVTETSLWAEVGSDGSRTALH